MVGKTFKIVRLNQTGMGILEVVVAAGIMGIIALGIADVIAIGQNGAISISKRTDQSQLQSFISSIFSNSATCTASGLIGQQAPVPKLPTTPDTVSVPTLTFANMNFDDGANNLFDGGQIAIQSLKYHSVSVVGNISNVVVRMQVNVSGIGGQTIVGGNLLAPVDFPLVLTTGGGVITGCGSNLNSLGNLQCTQIMATSGASWATVSCNATYPYALNGGCGGLSGFPATTGRIDWDYVDPGSNTQFCHNNGGTAQKAFITCCK